MSIFYKPSDGWSADCIPFYWRGEYHLFYLKDYRNKASHGEGTPWFHVSTRDFVTFTDHGEALPRGTRDEQDLYVFTGCVIEQGGTFHIFYTGHNPHFRAQGRAEQAVMHAMSDDLLTWRKVPEDTFYAPTDLYEPHDWRDPFVFWDDESGQYCMLLAARLKGGPSLRRGCTTLCVSPDLRRWEVCAPFWAPGLFYTHECPDLFRMGDWWYLVFSEFSCAYLTRYRMSRSLRGPWLVPANDSFDGRAFYAAKTVSDGDQRFIVGWNPTREQERNDRPWQWGGHLVVHQIAQAADGTLTSHLPDAVGSAYTTQKPIRLRPRVGAVEYADDRAILHEPGSFACAIAGPLPESCRLTARITFSDRTFGCGLLVQVSDDLESGYYIRLEPGRQRLVLDHWPRPGDIPFMAELERPLAMRPGQSVELVAIIDGTVCEVYAGGTTVMSARLYNLPSGTWGTQSPDEGAIATGLLGLPRQERGLWGIFVSEGIATFEAVSLAER